jgi:predicted amidophosphoribosyltransferase
LNCFKTPSKSKTKKQKQVSKKIEISVEELNSLRRLFNQAEDIFQRLGVGGDNPITPNLTPSQKRQMKYEKMLDSEQRGKKPEHLKKNNPRK